MLSPERLRGRPVVLFGAGRENAAFAQALIGVAESVVVLDEGGAERAAGWTARFGDTVPFLDSPDALLAATGDLDAPGLLAVTPGIPKHHPWIGRFVDAGWTATSATAEWIAATHSTVIGVTGTKGKSTTSSLTSHILESVGREAVFGGNIGIPAFGLAAAPTTVLELSSYQSSYLTVSPHVAVVTSLYPEHLDWHGSEQEYYDDKLRLLDHGPAHIVLNALDERLLDQLERHPAEATVELVGTVDSFHLGLVRGAEWLLRGAEPVLPLARFAVRGAHNRLNLALAVAAVHAAGVPLSAIRDAAERILDFEALAHRLEAIPDAQGIEFVDDVLSTIPQATERAIAAFPERPLTLIVGGQDRGVDLTPLAAALRAADQLVAVIGLPETGHAIVAALRGTGVVAHAVAELEEGVALARALTPAGGVVLLSPAAASYNRYTGHEAKAADFRRAIAATAPQPRGLPTARPRLDG